MAIPMARRHQMLKKNYILLTSLRTGLMPVALSFGLPQPLASTSFGVIHLTLIDALSFFGLCPFLFFVWFFRSLFLPRVQQGCLLHRCVWEGRLVWERNWMVKISGVFQRSLFLGIIWHTFLLAAIFNLVDVVWYTANLILLENSTGSPKWTRAMSFCKREASYLNKMHCWIQIT